MKKLGLLTLLILAFSSISYSQIGHDLEIFSETSDKFKVYVNGQLLSNQYGSHVKLDNVQHDNLNVKIEFEDAAKEPIVKKYCYLADPGQETEPKSPQSNVYKIKQTKKGKMKFVFASRAYKKIQPVVHQTTVVQGNQPQRTGGSVTISTPVGGISLTIFD